jgi:hypothetical protein
MYAVPKILFALVSVADCLCGVGFGSVKAEAPGQKSAAVSEHH